MVKAPVRIALVGATGVIGRRHLKHILDESEAELAAIIDVDATGPELAKTHGVPHFNNIDEFTTAHKAGKSVAEAIILATPTHTHVPFATKLLEHDLGILIEKPVAVNSDGGRELIAACASHENSVVMVGHHRRHNSYVRAIKKVVEGGKLGKVMAVNGVWTMRKSDEYFRVPWRQQPGSGGVILTNAIHEIDMLQHWLGDIAEVYAMEGMKERPSPVDSTVQMILKFSSGVLGSFLLSDTTVSPNSWESATGENPNFPVTGEPSLTIFGSQGTIDVPSLVRYHYDDRLSDERNWNFCLSKDESAKHEVDDIPPFTGN